MRKLSTILLLSFMLIPLFWNGISLMHYLVEHTHSFCAGEQDHQHASTEDCETICHISPLHNQTQSPHKSIEFYELKQCITEFHFLNNQVLVINSKSTTPDYLLLYGRLLSDDIFRPPIA